MLLIENFVILKIPYNKIYLLIIYKHFKYYKYLCMNNILTKEQRSNLEKEIDSRWGEVLGMKGLKASIFISYKIKGLLRKEYIRVISEIIFIKKAKIIHGNKYDYRLVYYNGNHTKVIIICPKHGEFFIEPNSHLRGKSGCPKCGLEKRIKSKTKSQEQFYVDANKIHGDKFIYQDDYVNSHTEIKIWCKKHKEYFYQTPANHLQGHSCPKCGWKKRAKSKTKTQEKFNIQSREIHGNNYIYFGDYINNKTEMKMYCKKCKEYFYQTPNCHLNQKSGCPRCGRENQIKKQSKSPEQFEKQANEIHDYKYIYFGDYVNAYTEIKIWCKKHEYYFYQTPDAHLQGRGCPKCKQSKGEIQIEKYLKENNIKYETQKKFDRCMHKRLLPFDFYLPDYDLLIEFQGEQHYKIIKYFGGEEGYKQRQKRDQIKREFCTKPENPNLLEIKYTEINNINEILKTNIL